MYGRADGMPSFQLTVAVCTGILNKGQYVQHASGRSPRHENRSSLCWTDATDATPKTVTASITPDDHCSQDATGSEETQTDI
jgi:hypothetical protein